MRSTHCRRLGALVAAAASIAAALVVASPAYAAPSLPNDPAQDGYIGLCDEAGNNVTGGSVDAKPFVWKAVSSSHPAAAYQGKGQNAVLNIYQERPDVTPAEWSGGPLIATTFYGSKAHPMVQGTYADGSLKDFITQYPPQSQGLYELRIAYGKANYGLYSATYPATTIQVTGSRWRVISGGAVTCGAAKGISIGQASGVVPKRQYTARRPNLAEEAIAQPGVRGSYTAPPPATAGTSHHGRTSSGSADLAARANHSSSTKAAPQAAAASSAAMSPAAAQSSTGGGSSGTTWVWILLAGLAVGGLVGALATRRRGRPTNLSTE